MWSVKNWDIVLVTYNSANDLRSIWKDVPADIRDRVICVDNGSSDATVSIAQELFQKVIVTKNNGLSVSNNLGAVSGDGDFIFFLNPDVRPTLKGIEKIESELIERRGIVSPRLTYPDGRNQENVRGRPNLFIQVWNRIFGLKPDSEYLSPLKTESGECPWVLGAAIAMERRLWQELGGWPMEYFLYFEDTELCHRTWKHGESVYLCGEVRWVHSWKRDSKKLLSKATVWHLKSAFRFYSRHPSAVFGKWV